jgi:hypothetical protein
MLPRPETLYKCCVALQVFMWRFVAAGQVNKILVEGMIKWHVFATESSTTGK